MASATFSLTSPPLVDAKAAAQRQPAPHSVGLPSLPPPPHVSSPSRPQGRETWKTAAYCRRIAGNLIARATGVGTETAVEIRTETVGSEETTVGSQTSELSDIVKKIQDAWDKVEDKYAVSALGLAGAVALWGTGGMISAIDRLPVVPGVLEVVGIGCSVWFGYKNLVTKTDREALIAKLKRLYADII
ncbi:protein CURVATURE THYLAKOID 1B, chloroplastic-like [Canna indica]|uniref:Protein CURVATURE THYLAKOID 1B, chloroplastic-like n=1 Tax=Canna indica TaxID=4628 RepID=A0AAQ3KJK7_9LILI|nr:protein CURVATURE THYLAKOID 1B, chloroplastic-like [Canna indica]